MRTRVNGATSGDVACSIETAPITPLASVTSLTTCAASTCRRSTSSVIGSGRFVTYGTGSDVSMVSVVVRRPAFADSAFSCGGAVSSAAQTPATARTTAPVRPRRSFLLLFDIIRRPKSLSHFLHLDEREGIVDFLHDHHPLRGDAANRAVREPIVDVRGEGLAVRALDQRHEPAAALQHAAHDDFGRGQPAHALG